MYYAVGMVTAGQPRGLTAVWQQPRFKQHPRLASANEGWIPAAEVTVTDRQGDLPSVETDQ